MREKNGRRQYINLLKLAIWLGFLSQLVLHVQSTLSNRHKCDFVETVYFLFKQS
jgi:hypothetical protein